MAAVYTFSPRYISRTWGKLAFNSLLLPYFPALQAGFPFLPYFPALQLAFNSLFLPYFSALHADLAESIGRLVISSVMDRSPTD